MKTREQVEQEIVHQLNWRGPNGRAMAHIVLKRDDVFALIKREPTLDPIEVPAHGNTIFAP